MTSDSARRASVSRLAAAVKQSFSGRPLVLALDLLPDPDVAGGVPSGDQLARIQPADGGAQFVPKLLGPLAEHRGIEPEPAVLLHDAKCLAGTIEIRIYDPVCDSLHSGGHYTLAATGRIGKTRILLQFALLPVFAYNDSLWRIGYARDHLVRQSRVT